MDRQPSKRHGPPRVVIVAFCLLAALIAAAGWWLHRHTFWSDGRATRLAAAEYPTRRIIWTPARLLAAPTTAPASEPVYDPFVTDDGSQLYFVRGKPGSAVHARVFRCRRIDDRWSEAEAVEAVNLAGYDTLGPRVTADGRFLLFASNRPGGLGGFDLWAAPRVSGGAWGKPFNLGPSINSEFDEYNPDPTPDGTRLIFTTNRTAARREQLHAWAGTIRQTATGDFDLWITHLAPGSTTTPTTAPLLAFERAFELRGLNTPFTEGASCMSPAGDFLYFASNRPGGFGKFDLYRSRVHDGDLFDPPENLGPAVNSSANDADPTLAFDGFRLAFSSDRDSAYGDYRLYACDSREVFPERELPRFAMPSLRFGYGSLLLSALLMLPLILLLRNARSRALTTLQRCLILSLLLHAAAAFICSFVTVTRAAIGAGRMAGESTIPINLAGGGNAEAAIATSIRGQFALDPGDANAGSEALTSLSRDVAQAVEVRRPDAHPFLPAVDVHPDRPPVPAVAHALPSDQPPIAGPRLPSAAPMGPLAVRAQVPAVERTTANAAEPAVAGLDIASDLQRAEFSSAPVHGPSPTTVPSFSSILTASPRPPATSSPMELVPPWEGATPSGKLATTPLAVNARPVADVSPRDRVAVRNDSSEEHDAERDVLLPTTRPSANVAQRADGTMRTGAQALVPPPHATTAPAFEPIALAASHDVLSPKLDGTTPQLSVQISRVVADAAVPTVGGGTAHTPRPTGALVDANDVAPPAVRKQDSAPRSINPSASVASIPATTTVNMTPAMPSTLPLRAGAPRPLAATTQAAVSIAAIAGPLGPPDMPAPEPVFPRSEKVRQQRVETLGGTPASEEAVDHALAYLARQQEPTGRWTLVIDGSPPPGERTPHPHDAACTGLALLTFLARNHSPSDAGPYRDVVTRGLDFLVALQSPDGDLRGLEAFRGPGSERADMYDHAIATLALAEAAAMSGDPRYADAALLAARFIVSCQDPRGGGWRYSPQESGDTSVFGWQVMALHAAERLGFAIPDATRKGALHYVDRVRAGERGALASYRPGQSPTQAMTAELLYARQLLDQPPAPADVREAAVFFAQSSGSQVDLYCWYYGSLSLVHSPERELWNAWNPVVRDVLVRLQRRGENAENDGSWNTDFRWASRGGRVFSTALATLTLEVYYRYGTPPTVQR